MDLFSKKATELIRLDKVTIDPAMMTRISCGIPLINERCLGGNDEYGFGFAQGSVLMLGGEPGTGKTTLLIQLLDRMAGLGIPCVYNSAEEPAHQLKMTAERCLVENASNIYLGNVAETGTVIELVKENGGKVLVLDSIQGFKDETLETRSKGLHMQGSCDRFIKFAKDNNVTLIIICQLTSTGDFKGPKDLEHNVDICGKLYKPKARDEMEKARVLNFSKNRFGYTEQHCALPWDSDHGRYDFSNLESFKLEEEEQDEVKAEPVSKPLRQVSLNTDGTEHSAEQKVAMASALIGSYNSKSPMIIMDVMNTVRSKYGEFELTEDHHADLGLPRDRMARLLTDMGRDPRFKVVNESPLTVLV